MKLQDIFDQLVYGELSQIAIGSSGGISDEDTPKLISHINLGLLELHKRFDLRREEVHIQQYDHIQTYTLDIKYASTNTSSTEPIKYIMDSTFEPYTGNALKIERVFNEEGYEFVLNDDSDYTSLHTPNHLSVMVPLPEPTASLLIEYRASLPKIPLTGVDPTTYEVDLPITYLEALLYYVAGRVFTPLTDLSIGSNDGATYMAKFEQSCLKLTEMALVNKSNNLDNKLMRNDWV